MNIDLTDEETAALIKELHDIIESDHYPFSPRILTLKGILDRIEPPPIHEPLPEPKRYEPPRFNREGAVMGEVGTGSADDAGRRGRRHALGPVRKLPNQLLRE
jgi:hypothetical protein